MSMAAMFGSHPSVAAFMVAFRFANLLRRVLGDGALQSAFIPHFEDLRAKHSGRAIQLFINISLVLAFSLLAIIGFVELGLTAGNYFAVFSSDTSEILRFAGWMFPGIFFLCLYGLNSSLMQCERHYFIPSVAPLAFNIVWIVSIFFLHGLSTSRAMEILSIILVFAY